MRPCTNAVAWQTGAQLLICLALSGPVTADGADTGNGHMPRPFKVEKAALGMTIGRVLEIYPDAEITLAEPSCFHLGNPIRVPQLTSRIVRRKSEVGEMVMRFDPPIRGGRLSRILLDRPVDRSTFDIDAVVTRLSGAYGVYDRILFRRKMEPAGRIVGFEWRKGSGATLRVELRNDFSSPARSLRLSILARSPVQPRVRAARIRSRLCNDPRTDPG